MGFLSWLNEYKKPLEAIFVDLDNTLVYNGESLKLRPYAHEFIIALQKLAPVSIVTHGEPTEQKRVVKHFRFNLPVFANGEYGKIAKNSAAILIDDKPPSDYRTQEKMKAIGIGKDRVVTSKAWFGEEDDANLKEVLNKIHQLEWVEKKPKRLPEKQSFKSYKEARDMAKERSVKFSKQLQEAAGEHKVITSIKSETSCNDKTQKRGWKIEEVYDILRAAILVGHKDQIDEVVERIKKTFTTRKVEHKTKPEEPFGCYGITNVDVIVDGLICEIQVMTNKLWDYKLEADKIYRKYRTKDDIPKEVIEKSKELFRKGNA